MTNESTGQQGPIAGAFSGATGPEPGLANPTPPVYAPAPGYAPASTFVPPPGFALQAMYPPAPGWLLPPGYVPPPGFYLYRVKPPPYVPGVFLYGLTILLVLMGLYGASLPELLPLAMIAVMAGLTVGLVWLSAFFIASGDTRMHFSRSGWARWAGIPIACFTCLALILSGVPGYARFQASRPALEQAAAAAKTGATYDDGWIGLMPVHEVRVDGAATLFILSGSGSADGECGLAYGDSTSPLFQSWLNDVYDVSDYGHGWWYWCGYPSD
jgi:hypothetical protein